MSRIKQWLRGRSQNFKPKLTDPNVKRKIFHWNSDELFTICSQIACTVFPFFFIFSFPLSIWFPISFIFLTLDLGIICNTFCHLLRFILLSFHLIYRIHVMLMFMRSTLVLVNIGKNTYRYKQYLMWPDIKSGQIHEGNFPGVFE